MFPTVWSSVSWFFNFLHWVHFESSLLSYKGGNVHFFEVICVCNAQ